MAIETSTTAPRAVKAPIFAATPYGLQFIRLLNAWGEHISAERVLASTEPTDPRHGRAQSLADEALSGFHRTLLSMIEAIPSDPLDIPLRRMTLLVATLVRENRASAFARYETVKADLAPFFAVSGEGPVVAEVRKMIAAAERRIGITARLTCYRTEGAAREAELFAA
jgi:hypothetical protein